MKRKQWQPWGPFKQPFARHRERAFEIMGISTKDDGTYDLEYVKKRLEAHKSGLSKHHFKAAQQLVQRLRAEEVLHAHRRFISQSKFGYINILDIGI